MKNIILPIALLACVIATSCNTNKRLYETGMAYHQANQTDHERIMELKNSGNPDVWFEIFERYCSIKGRSDEMAQFPPEVKQYLNYTPLDLDDEITTARNKAEAYLTAKISQTLNNESPDLDAVDKMIRDLERVNRDNSHINDFKLKSMAKRYGGLERLMHMEVYQEQATANRDESVSFKETNGNLSATVTDHKLSKSATVKGQINFVDPSNRRLLFSMPFEMTSKFEHSFSTVDGPTEACSEQTLENLKQKPVPFPTDESMINDAKRQMFNSVYQRIQ